jgi:hypothetical protein
MLKDGGSSKQLPKTVKDGSGLEEPEDGKFSNVL